ncbi:hypothetical protein APHAL10511_006911 [Amanita phalloides]|nr:hypothetical protein APHAL10511_006911 [Amanita phalloides]
MSEESRNRIRIRSSRGECVMSGTGGIRTTRDCGHSSTIMFFDGSVSGHQSTHGRVQDGRGSWIGRDRFGHIGWTRNSYDWEFSPSGRFHNIHSGDQYWSDGGNGRVGLGGRRGSGEWSFENVQ